jgi:type I restriction enzyme, S subunit
MRGWAMSEPRRLVPRLRFPEFRDAAPWRFEPLRRLAIRCKRKNSDESITRVLTNSAEFGVVDQRDYFDKEIATQGRLETYCVVELGDYVYNPRISAMAPVGPISKNNVATGVMSPLYTVFRFNDPRNDFYRHYFNTTGWHSYMRQASSTGARHDRMAIGSDDFMGLPVPVASPEERQKIADCLNLLDELIAAQGRKVEALMEHKNGLMDRIFPRDGETQPQFRFPEFLDSNGWSESTLGACFEPIRNGFVGTATPYYTGAEGVLYLQGRNVKAGRIEPSHPIFVTREFHERQSKSHLKLGDLLMVQSGHVGECAAVSEEFVGCNCHALIILTPSRELIPEFFVQYFYAPPGKRSISQITTGNTIKHILSSELKSLKLLIPSVEEQQHIADCLAAIDQLITAANEELDTLKTHKQALMQQLFPSAEALEA